MKKPKTACAAWMHQARPNLNPLWIGWANVVIEAPSDGSLPEECIGGPPCGDLGPVPAL